MTKSTLVLGLVALVAGDIWRVTCRAQEPRAVLQLQHDEPFTAFALSPDGRMLAAGTGVGKVELWELLTGARRMRFPGGHESEVNALAFSPDGQVLASAGSDGIIKLWAVRAGKVTNVVSGHVLITAIAFSPDGKTLASGGWEKGVRLWNPRTGKLKSTLRGRNASILSVTFSPDGNLLATSEEDNTISLWEPMTGKLVTSLTGHKGKVSSLAFRPDGKAVASASWDRTVRVWSVPDGKEQKRLIWGDDGTKPYSIAFSRDGRTLASGGACHVNPGWLRVATVILVWDASSGKRRATLRGHQTIVYWLAFSPDGRTLGRVQE